MAINEFGITPTIVSSQVQNLSISDSTSPNTSAVLEMITLAAAEVEREASVVGIDTQGYDDDGTATYLILRRMVLYKVLGELLVARERDPTAGAYYIGRFDDLRDRLRVRPSVVADTESGPDRLSYLDLEGDKVYDQAFYRTIAGKTILGGL